MTDRELLELAAKAAGLNKPIWIDYERAISYMADCLRPSVKFWNPLDDDGDALRLAIKLGIEIHPDRDVSEIHTAYCIRNPRLVGYNTTEEYAYDGDDMAAARRAIVRAAAEIGRTM